MKIAAVGALAVALGCAIPAFAKDPQPQFKSVEAKHFSRAEGVELSPAFSDYLYAELRAELIKAKLFGQVLGHRRRHVLPTAPPAQDFRRRADPGQLRDVRCRGGPQPDVRALENRHVQRHILPLAQARRL